MDHFQYRDGQMHVEDVPLATIAESVGTPFYCYSSATLERHYDAFADAFEGQNALVAYAIKANSNMAVIRTLGLRGAGVALVSGGELRRAQQAGIPAQKIVFSGVGKTEAELIAGLDAGILQFNVESEPELRKLSEIAVARGKTAPVAIRVNPDVDAGVHHKITTGLKENKFGIEWTAAREIYAKARDLPGIEVVGLSVHIGSQLLDLEPFRKAFLKISDLVAMLRQDGHDIRNLDLGGGLGIPYDGGPSPAPADYAALVKETVGNLDCLLVLEPGRMITGNAGVLVTRLLYRKEGATRTFYVVDAGMNDLMRPTLYDAYHHMEPVRQSDSNAEPLPVDVVGPICETGDTFGKQRPLPAMEQGDLLIMRTAGAYGAVMANTYNTRAGIPEVLASGDRWTVVRRRMEVADLLALESMPDWLEGDDDPA
ncbi:diaminopimelate decarboxylase [Magnetospira sp. QH-2]|uniref:diaminopimelate decarboxylase n=1 Tax=Magnetospira sp. (strain QH-2) TaxID=1288970 RepID=UPI0003E81293|nr:diaminopimelate decarboxylase [Magnetospira sp. QH-2]CCQ74740.1 diaminopimelate decarboxylase [Magnetospira sp. QH-2]